MPTFKPSICDYRAYHHLKNHLDLLEANDGLLAGAVAVAMHAFDDCDPAAVAERLDDIAEGVLDRVHCRDDTTLLAHLHDELFERRGFGGDAHLCRHPCAAMLPFVLARGCGLPVLLCLAYKLIAERIGLRVEGISLPHHFLVHVWIGDEPYMIDPYNAGQLLTPREAASRQLSTSRALVGSRRELQAPAAMQSVTHRQWLFRLMDDLQDLQLSGGYSQDWWAIEEMRGLLAPDGGKGRVRESAPHR